MGFPVFYAKVGQAVLADAIKISRWLYLFCWYVSCFFSLCNVKKAFDKDIISPALKSSGEKPINRNKEL